MELTPEEQKDIQDIFNNWIIPSLAPDERLDRFGITLDDILSYYGKNEVLSKFKPEDIEAYLKSLKKNQ